MAKRAPPAEAGWTRVSISPTIGRLEVDGVLARLASNARVTLDCAPVRGATLASLHAIASCARVARRQGGGLRITNVSPQLRDALLLTGLAAVLELPP